MHQNNMKYWIRFSLVCLATAYIVLAVIAYSLFWPAKTLTIIGFDEKNPIKVTNDTVHPGEPLEYKLNYCKYTDAPSVVHRTLVDGQIITLTNTAGQLPLGCHVVTVKTAVVPTTINPGKYYLDVVVEYKLNAFRSEYIHYHTNYFTVVEGDKTATSTGEVIITD